MKRFVAIHYSTSSEKFNTTLVRSDNKKKTTIRSDGSKVTFDKRTHRLLHRAYSLCKTDPAMSEMTNDYLTICPLIPLT